MNVKNLLTTVSHKIHHHEENPENSFQLSYDVNPVKVAKKHSKKVIKEDEFKSKWDQFCDFTSLNGFRLLSSKFSWAMRITTATIMLFATCGLCWNVSGAFIKYFNPSGQKNTVVHQGEFERMELPKVRFCHQSKNAINISSRTNVDPDMLSHLHEDSRRLFYLYNIQGLTVDMLKKEKLPHFNYFITEDRNATFKEKDCSADFYELQNQCKNTTLYPSYCSIFRSPPNYRNFDNLTFIEMLQAKHDYDDCLGNEYLDSNNNPHPQKVEAFCCCRLRKAISEFNKIKNENFEEFLSDANKQKIFIWSTNKNLEASVEWDSIYGTCAVYSLNNSITDNSLDGKPLLTVHFLLNTFAYDILSDDGVILSFVFDNYRANEFLLLPNAQTTIKVKESVEINDYDCTSKYPPICSDAHEPYNDRTCEECYNARKNCHCDNPLKKSKNFKSNKASICNVHDSVLCLLQRESTEQNICPNPCKSKYYKSFTTLDNLNITTLDISKEEMTNITANFVPNINSLINTIDKTVNTFPLGNHALWEAVYFLEEIFEEFWRILFLVTKLSGKPLPITKNATEVKEYFKSYTLNRTVVDSLIQNYSNYIFDGIISSFDNNPLREEEINQRSIEANLLLGGIPNPPAIINYYRTANVLQKTINALNELKMNIQKALNENKITSDKRKFLLELNSLKIFGPNNIKDAEVIKKFKDFLEEYRFNSIDSYHENIAHLTLSFVTKRFSKIEYFQSYTFWNFLYVGGIMGLYFGLTMVTIYEMITFTFIDREPPESFTRKEKKLTRKTLYPKILLSDEPIPTLL